jgi:UDP-N-acetylglucosamine acyltransferase
MIDSRAVISPQAEIAAGVEIGPFSIIGPNVSIGTGTWIGPHVVINGPTRIGADNKIFQFASLGDAPQDKKYKGEPTRLEIGDRNVIREFVTVNRGTTHGEGVTRIGDENLLMAYAHVAHDCRLGNQIVLSNVATLGGHVEIGDFAILGGLSAVHQFTKVGAYCFIANNAAVTRDVPPYVMAIGQPAEPHTQCPPCLSSALPVRPQTEDGVGGTRQSGRHAGGDPALRRLHPTQFSQHRSLAQCRCRCGWVWWREKRQATRSAQV